MPDNPSSVMIPAAESNGNVKLSMVRYVVEGAVLALGTLVFIYTLHMSALAKVDSVRNETQAVKERTIGNEYDIKDMKEDLDHISDEQRIQRQKLDEIHTIVIQLKRP